MDNGSDFFESAKPLIGRFIHPNDTDKITCLLDKDAMLKALKANKGAFNTEYRFIINSKIYYCRAGIRMTKSKSHVLVSISNLDDEDSTEQRLKETERLNVTYAQITELLAEQYDNIYYVDINTNSYVSFASAEFFANLDRAQEENDFLRMS